jgi:hypothetical protein
MQKEATSSNKYLWGRHLSFPTSIKLSDNPKPDRAIQFSIYEMPTIPIPAGLQKRYG